MMKKYTFTEMKEIQKEKNLHWFDKGAMRFFNTVLETQPNMVNIFITSEKQEDWHKRKYTLRWFNEETGNVETLGHFMEYTTIDAARAARRRFTATKRDLMAVRP
jgi:hypothetical protein